MVCSAWLCSHTVNFCISRTEQWFFVGLQKYTVCQMVSNLLLVSALAPAVHLHCSWNGTLRVSGRSDHCTVVCNDLSAPHNQWSMYFLPWSTRPVMVVVWLLPMNRPEQDIHIHTSGMLPWQVLLYETSPQIFMMLTYILQVSVEMTPP